jgi:signal transduction histidine kinase
MDEHSGLAPFGDSSSLTVNDSPQTSQHEPISLDDEQCRRCRTALATAAHDMKTPIAIMSGYLELICNPKLGPLNNKQQDILAEMRGCISRLNQYAGDFTTLYSLQAQVKLDLGEHDLNLCVGDIFAVWVPRFEKSQVAHYLLQDPALPRLNFDYDKIQHVISNLIENATKFTPPQGSIWVQTSAHHWERRLAQLPGVERERRQGPSRAPNAVRVTVSDTGPGIAPEYHQEVFREFGRIKRDRNSGTGLGLAIAKRIVEMHNGKIWLEGNLGEGTRISFVLPL